MTRQLAGFHHGFAGNHRIAIAPAHSVKIGE
jgi:hypothetical protein